jgi:hypothetical protein
MPYVHTNGTAIRVTQVQGIAQYQDEVIDTFLRLLADRGVVHIVQILQSGIFKHPTGSLANSVRGDVDGQAVLWWSDVSYASAQEYGVRPHQMWHLLNKTVPITIHHHTGSETKIYRRVTLKSLLAGKFYNPGYPGKFFMRRGIQLALNDIPQILNQAQQLVFHLHNPGQGAAP